MSLDAIAVVQKGDHALCYYDLEGEELARVALDPYPHEWAVSADRQRAFISHFGLALAEDQGEGGNTVSVVDLPGRRKLGALSCGGHRRPHGITLDNAGALYVLSEADSRLLVSRQPTSGRFDSDQPSGGEGSHMVTVSSDGKTAFISNMRSNTVTVVFPDDPECPPVELESGRRPEGSVLDRNEQYLYVACRESARIMVVDVMNLQVLEPIRTRPGPVRLCWDHRRRLLAPLYHDRSLALVNPANHRIDHVPLPANPVSVSFDADSGLALVSTLGDEVCVIDVESRSLERRIPTRADPDPAMLLQLPDWN